MKKIILNLLLLSLFTTHSIADDKILITGTILPSAIVAFEPVNTIALGGDDFFKSVDIDYGSVEMEGSIEAVSKDFYVKSNNPSGVSIVIEADTGEDEDGALTGPDGGRIPVGYVLHTPGYASYNLGDSIILTDSQNDGEEKVKSIAFSPARPISSLKSGVYDTVLKVTVSCR